MQRGERLQKILSAAGIASRRAAEVFIREGRITVNGHVVRELGTRADPDRDQIRIDGRRISATRPRVYFLLNKPRRVVSTVMDPQGRTKVTDLVRTKERIYPVGRLDYHTEGLILLTNDGEFARLIGSAGERMTKTYHAKVRSRLEETELRRLRAGVRLADGTLYASCKIRPLREGHNSWYEVTLTQGRNQQIRRMFESVGHPVMKLRRVAIGFLTGRGLPLGRFRPLTEQEVARLYKLFENQGQTRTREGPRRLSQSLDKFSNYRK